ncbi:MAG: tRNA adenosine(34) deaminase TadA [Thermodesulfovibrionales bacterium]
MGLALKEAALAGEEGDIPVGAVLVKGGRIIASARNRREASGDPTAHAEVLALREGARALGQGWRLTDATLYVTKEPCVMCAGAMVNARLGRLVFGCGDTKAGAVANLYQVLSDRRLNHQVEVVSGVLESECSGLLKAFFQRRRRGTGAADAP